MSTVESVMTGLEAPAAAATTPAPPTPEETTAAVLPAGETTPTEQPTDGAALETPEVEQEPNLEEAPETSGDFAKYKPLFKDNPELRNIIGREQAFSSLGSFSEVREIVQRIPTVADAEQLVADSENRREMGRTFREDVPTFVESLKNADPLAFQQFAAELPSVLKEFDPSMWTAQARLYVPEVLTNLALSAQEGGDQELLNAIHAVANKLGSRLGGQQQVPQRGNSEVERLRREKQERDESDQKAAFDTFWNQTDTKVIDHDVALIEAAINKAFPQATEDQRYRMVNEGFKELQTLISRQPQTVARLNELRAKAEKSARTGRLSYTEQKEIFDFLTAKTKLIVPHAVKPVIDVWSKMILKSNKDSIEKKTALAAKTRDVGTGPGATTSAASPTNAGQGKRHAKDIYTEIEQGRYVKR